MAHLIPPSSSETVAIVLTRNEALTVLATLRAYPTYANRDVRDVLVKYIDRLPLA